MSENLVEDKKKTYNREYMKKYRQRDKWKEYIKNYYQVHKVKKEDGSIS